MKNPSMQVVQCSILRLLDLYKAATSCDITEQAVCLAAYCKIPFFVDCQIRMN